MTGWAKCCAALLCGCAVSGRGESPPPIEMLVLTQTPRRAGSEAARDRLDQGYPAGSRVVVAAAPWGAPTVRVLSEGLHSAGGPVVTYDGERVYFAGKTGIESEWQIYEARIGGGHRRVVTSMPGALPPRRCSRMGAWCLLRPFLGWSIPAPLFRSPNFMRNCPAASRAGSLSGIRGWPIRRCFRMAESCLFRLHRPAQPGRHEAFRCLRSTTMARR